MKAIFINAEKREISEVEYAKNQSADGPPTIGGYLGGWIEAAFRWPNGDVLYVDEEGLLKPTRPSFYCRFRTDQPMAGNGLLVGREVEENDDWYTEPPTMTVERLQQQIIWMSIADFDKWMRDHADVPAGTITMVRDGVAVTEVLHTYGDLHAGMSKKEEDE